MSVGTEGRAPLSRQPSPGEYEQLVGAIREIAHRVVPLNATVLVVSRGDDKLLELGPRRALHFPQGEDGGYAGYHPGDSDEAIVLLENMRARGAEFLLVPSVAFWWLDYYDAFTQYIEHRYRLVEAGEHCWIAALTENRGATADRGSVSQPSMPPPAEQLRELLDSLLPEDARTAILTTSQQDLVGIDGYETWLVPGSPKESPNELGEAVTRLDEDGVRFLVVPKALFGWLEAQPELADHLRERHLLVTRQAHLCEVYELRRSLQPFAGGTNKRNGSARSFGESLRGMIFRTRRNDRGS